MPKSILQGQVVAISGKNTIKVKVIRTVSHKKYGKRVKVSKNYLAHSIEENYNIGDIVKIIECKPISKLKKFEVLTEDKSSK